MDHRETTVTLHGVTRTIRTERTGTVRQLETAHSRAVRAAVTELHAAGKPAALAAAKKAAAAATHAARNHCSGPLVTAADEARAAVKRIEGFKPTVMSFPSFAAMTRPYPPVKFDLDPTDPCLSEALFEVIDPEQIAAEAAAKADADAAAAVADAPRPLVGPGSFLDSLLAPYRQPAPAEEPEPAEEPMDLEAFLNDFFAPAAPALPDVIEFADGETMPMAAFMGLDPDD